MTIHEHELSRSDEMTAILHAMLDSEVCGLETIALVLEAQGTEPPVE